MIILSEKIISLWIGSMVSVPLLVHVLVCTWVLINAYNGIYSHFYNGVGKIRLQVIIAIIQSILNIPLALILGFKFGIVGILLANVIIALGCAIVYPIQYKKIITNTDHGIWGA